MKINCKGKRAEILIYEDIGEGFFGGISAKTFAEELNKLGKLDEIDVRINSVGGNVFDGVAIFNSLVKNKARVTVNIDGLAASISSLIAMAGDEITIAANGFMMVHNPWVAAMGTATQLRDTANTMDKVRETILGTYISRSNVDRDVIDEMMTDEGTWLTAEEAYESGLVHKITEEQLMAAHFDSKLSGIFDNAPKQLKDLINKCNDREMVVQFTDWREASNGRPNYRELMDLEAENEQFLERDIFKSANR